MQAEIALLATFLILEEYYGSATVTLEQRNYSFCYGIEGYIHPTNLAKPANATPLLRAYNPTRDDYAIFPQQHQTIVASQGYTQYLTTLGYVYLNNGSRPTAYQCGG